MNAPFAPPGPAADDEPQLRSLLEREARQQPPVSPDFRAGVDRRVRRSRARVAIVAAPVVALVLGGAVLLAPGSDPDATIQTAADGSAAQAPAEPVSSVTDCGTVEAGPDRVDPETAPLDCFIAAFNGGTDASLVVLVHGPSGGTLTETVRTAPNKQITVTASGSMSVAMPSIGGLGGGIVPNESEGEAKDCGTFTISEVSAPEDVGQERIACMMQLLMSGSPGGFTVVVMDASGGSMTARVDVAAGAVTLTVDGELTQSLPELAIPSDLTAHLPPNGFGIDELGLDGSGFGPYGSGGPETGPATGEPVEGD